LVLVLVLVWKIPPKNPKFFNFFPLDQKKSHQVGSKSTRGKYGLASYLLRVKSIMVNVEGVYLSFFLMFSTNFMSRYGTKNLKFNVEGVAVFVISGSTNDHFPKNSLRTEVPGNLGCKGPFLKNYPSGESWIAIIQRGECKYNEKIKNAMKLNASGVLIYDSENKKLCSRCW